MSARRCKFGVSVFLLSAILATVAFPQLGEGKTFARVVNRPLSTTWSRTQCGSPSGSADIPSRWAKDVSPDKVPLTMYPRPNMVRKTKQYNNLGKSKTKLLRDVGDEDKWHNLNGLWEWETTNDNGKNPPFGKTLNGSILVPFPVESCLSSQAPSSSKESRDRKKMWYRTQFSINNNDNSLQQRTLLHFGAVDWQTRVYFNKQYLGNHTGGYDGFSFDLTDFLSKDGNNELIVYVYDPSDDGSQPNGKQRISSIDQPGGDQYTPNSGIWQTVWLESVAETYIENLIINADMKMLKVAASVMRSGHRFVTDTGNNRSDHAVVTLTFDIYDGGHRIAGASQVLPGSTATIKVPDAKLWSPSNPHLYDLVVTLSSGGDSVLSYFGMRTFQLENVNGGLKRPVLNGKFTFMAGWLDQSWWPDGQYTAPSDDALKFDVSVAKTFGFNMVRLHQKVNPQRWYYHADQLGVAIYQDAVQKYHGATDATVPYFVHDLSEMIKERGNHPSIIQWETFNEADCWEVFTKASNYTVEDIVALARSLDWQHRLVDTDSGGDANKLAVGDVNDIHDYPYPKDPKPSDTKYAMIGEFGGVGAFVPGKEWVPDKCHTYLHVSTPKDEANTYINMTRTILSRINDISASVYTQITDVELECDGFLNYDRTHKFTDEDILNIRNANEALTRAQPSR
jgi:hypothetical protein